MTSSSLTDVEPPPQDPGEAGPAARGLVAGARSLRAGIAEARAAPAVRLRAARAAYEAARDDVVRQQLAALPLTRLKETTQGRLRLGAIEAAGYRTVGQAAAVGVARLQQLPKVGPQTASQVIAAARQLHMAMTHSVRLRLDPDTRPPLQSRLLAELHQYGVARQAVSPADENLAELAAALDAVLGGAGRAASRLRMFFSGRRKREAARDALGQLQTLMRSAQQAGLGKSVEALAAMCHLHLQGRRHFLVVCPASVLVNWTHEIQRHSELRPYRLHGLDRQRNFQAWTRTGGVAVTTYDSLRSLPRPAGVDLGMLVVDEAHYAKNLAAERTKAVRDWASATSRVLFLTGTPMENRVEEFRVLVSHLRPDLVLDVNSVDGLIGADRFRTAVAPVYLRRNQSDVLEELPPRLDTQEWVELKGRDLDAYRDAVATGNFMAMRRAAYAPGRPAGSAKLGRLAEIVEEAASNGRKVVVFSYFRGVLETVATVLGDLAVGPLTGSTPPIHRQNMVDQFTALPGPAVLVSQIQAGGVGLNIQAASVVILTEPQWKPTVEDQAVARCHRMGQVRPVDVHRLLAEDTVDQRMLELLAAKAVLFDEYVRRSELKDHSPDAVDISDLKTAQDVGTQVEAERRIIEMERKRLRMEAARLVSLFTMELAPTRRQPPAGDVWRAHQVGRKPSLTAGCA